MRRLAPSSRAQPDSGIFAVEEPHWNHGNQVWEAMYSDGKVYYSQHKPEFNPINIGNATVLPDAPMAPTGRAGDVTINRAFLVAMLRACGGHVTLDEYDMTADTSEVMIEFVKHENPRRWSIQLQENE